MNLTGKSVLVTGGNGFLGRHVMAALQRRDAQVRTFRSLDYDLRDFNDCDSILADLHYDLVIHCAAEIGGIGYSRKYPGQSLYDNLQMGVNLIESARMMNVAKVCIIGTACMYPRDTPAPFREEDIWNGPLEETNAPFAMAKKTLMVMAQAYRAEYEMNAITVIPTNLYGPGDNFDLETSHVIPALIRKIDAAMKSGTDAIEMWGDGTPIRDLLYVEDCAEAIVLACERYDSPAPINLGSGQEVSILALAVKIAKMMGFTGTFAFDQSKPNGQMRRLLDVTRAKALLGFEARTSLDEGLKNTIEWYKSL